MKLVEKWVRVGDNDTTKLVTVSSGPGLREVEHGPRERT